MENTPGEVLRVKDWNLLFENNRTRGLKHLDWVPIQNNLDGDGYTELVDHPNGAAHLGAWLAIVQIASRCQTRGMLTRDNGRPHTAESLARISRIPVVIFEEALPRLLRIGWLEITHVTVAIPRVPGAAPQVPAAIAQAPAGFPQDLAEEKCAKRFK